MILINMAMVATVAKRFDVYLVGNNEINYFITPYF